MVIAYILGGLFALAMSSAILGALKPEIEDACHAVFGTAFFAFLAVICISSLL